VKENNDTFVKTVKADYPIFSPKDAAELFKGRDLYIWGAGLKGRGFKRALERNGFFVKGFLDSASLLQGTKFQNTPVYDPDHLLKNEIALKESFILVASVDRKNSEIFQECTNRGLVKSNDFINIQELSPYYPTIEITGTCNLKCINCPRGNSLNPLRSGGLMKSSSYLKVAEKLIKEIPFLYLVDLYIWGEPLLNPDLPEIIRINNQLGIASGISSNLNACKNLEAVIKAGPAQIRVSMSGFGEKHYEKTHKGGKWNVLYQNLVALYQAIEKFQTGTLVEIYCPPRGLGEKPSPSGEDFSMLAVWSIIGSRAILSTISSITLFGSRNTASRFYGLTYPKGLGI